MHETVVSRPVLLVVDDELPILRVIGRLAAKVGFEVVTCTSSSEALRGLMRHPADLAMVDLGMPDVDGLDLRRQIQRMVPSCEVILMAARAGVDSAEKGVEPGTREYMNKPLDFERLREVLVEVRDGRERRSHSLGLESQASPELGVLRHAGSQSRHAGGCQPDPAARAARERSCSSTGRRERARASPRGRFIRPVRGARSRL